MYDFYRHVCSDQSIFWLLRASPDRTDGLAAAPVAEGQRTKAPFHFLSSAMVLNISGLCSSVRITIELPDLESQRAFNLARWAEILDDPRLAKLPERIETDRHGHILMTPPPAFRHSLRQDHIIGFLHSLMPRSNVAGMPPLYSGRR